MIILSCLWAFALCYCFFSEHQAFTSMLLFDCSAHFQRNDGQCRQDDSCNPEADGDLGFMELAFRPVLE
jgi:hypothetical protein